MLLNVLRNFPEERKLLFKINIHQENINLVSVLPVKCIMGFKVKYDKNYLFFLRRSPGFSVLEDFLSGCQKTKHPRYANKNKNLYLECPQWPLCRRDY